MLFCAMRIIAQEYNLSESIKNIAEDLAADDTDPNAVISFTDILHEIEENPVRINSANKDEISRLFFLSDFQVKALVDYVSASGPIVSVFEISNIPGFDKETALMISHFTTLEAQPQNPSGPLRNTLISNFSIKPGSSDSSTLGSDWKILNRYKFSTGGITGGFTTEKDPGEKMFTGTPKLPDFFSGYLSYSSHRVIKKIVIGDFSARFGQGSNINTGMRRRISMTSPGYMSASDEIKPYTSSAETKFFRGIATELEFHNLEIFMLLSKNYLDATLSSSTGLSNDCIKTFYDEGIHNNPSLLNKKHNVSVLSYAVDLAYDFSKIKFGITCSGNTFSLPVKPDFSDPEKIYDSEGTRNILYSVYYNTFIKKILLYGELTLNDSKKHAVIQGISMRPSDRLSINFLIRCYSSGLSSYYGQGPGISSKSSNENGLLGNFTFEAFKHFFISGGYDVREYPWIRYRCKAPSDGTTSEFKFMYIPSENLAIDATCHFVKSMIDNDDLLAIRKQDQKITRNFKINVKYKINKNLGFGSRMDYMRVSPSGSTGFSLCQDVNIIFSGIPLTIWVRYCIFDTTDWDSRIYIFENDLLYSFSIPALYGEGTRNYVMAKWEIGKIAEVRVKYGLTSSLTDISVKNTNELKLQFRVLF